MRLLDLAAPAQEILLGDEGEAIDPAAEAIELDAELDLRRCNRLVVAIGVNPEFRLHPVFEDRHLDREIAVAEHPAAMRPTLVFGRGRRRMLLGFVGRGALTGGGEQVAGEQTARNGGATGAPRFSARIGRASCGERVWQYG